MTEHHVSDLKEDLEDFRREKEDIRKVIGQIGGGQLVKRDKLINLSFIIAIIILFIIEIIQHLTGSIIPIPPLFSIELGILIVSVKIIWMIHAQN